MKTKNKAALVILMVLITSFFVGCAGQIVAVGTSYKSKTVCSEVFVAGRAPETILQELLIDDLEPLKYIKTDIDYDEKTVTSSFYGIKEFKTVYSDQYGCSLGVSTDELVTGELVTGFPAESFESNFEIDLNTTNIKRIVNESFVESDSEKKRRTRAVVILHKGNLIAEQYSDDINSDTPLLGWSVTKSVMNALTGILVRQGRVDLEMKVFPTGKKDGRENITVSHLLNMTSGLEFNEELSDPLADVVRMILQEKDMAEFATSKDMNSAPGTTWYYSSGNTVLLSKLMHNILGTTDYRSFPTKELFNRIGMEHPFLESDSTGTFVGSSFMYATARDWARFGQLYLQDGVWENERLLPEGWVKYSVTPTSVSEEHGYGAHFWLDIPEEYKSLERVTLPEGTFHAVGHEGQFITIVPSHNLVVVRLGKTRYPKAWEHDLFVDCVIAAME